MVTFSTAALVPQAPSWPIKLGTVAGGVQMTASSGTVGNVATVGLRSVPLAASANARVVTARNMPWNRNEGSPTTIAAGGTTTLTFTLTNPSPFNPAQNVSFTDAPGRVAVLLRDLRNLGEEGFETPAQAARQAAQAARETARLDLEYCQVKSPIDGRVSRALILMLTERHLA